MWEKKYVSRSLCLCVDLHSWLHREEYMYLAEQIQKCTDLSGGSRQRQYWPVVLQTVLLWPRVCYRNPALTEAAEGHVMYLTQQLHAPEHIAAPVVLQLTIFVVGLHESTRIVLLLLLFPFPSFLLFLLLVLTHLLVPFSTDQE